MLMHLRRLVNRLPRRQRGQSAMMFMLTLLGAFSFMAMALDAGLWAMDHRRAQNQVDAAALAGAGWLADNGISNDGDYTYEYEQVRLEVEHFILANNGDPDRLYTAHCRAPYEDGWPAGTGIDSSIEDRAAIIFYAPARDDLPFRDADVRVCIRRPSPSILSQLSSWAGVNVSAVAQARMKVTISNYALMAMKETTTCSVSDGKTLQQNGADGSVDVGDGWTYTRSTCDNGLYVVPNGTFNGGRHDVRGDAVNASSPDLDAWPPNYNVEWLNDPYRMIPQLRSGTCKVAPPGGFDNQTNWTPGTYCSRGPYNRPHVLAPGVYYFTDGLVASGGFTAPSGGVTLYFTCFANSDGCNGAQMGMGAAANTVTFGAGGLNDLTGDPNNYDMLFWFDRTIELGSCNLNLQGTTGLKLRGRLYAYPCNVDIGGSPTVGDSTGAPSTLNLSIVAHTLQFSGTPDYLIEYDDFPIPKFSMYLVE